LSSIARKTGEEGLWFNFDSSPEDLKTAGFSPDSETKILVHGYASNYDKFGTPFANGYFSNPELDDMNVILTDWNLLASVLNYPLAAMHAVTAGQRAGQVLGHLLVDQLGQDPKKIHLIGHSLGAHFVGHLGRELAINRTSIGRITGLDPAKPYFDITDGSNRLQFDDADFIDIVHTNSGELYEGCLSFPENMGDVDFYPNGGSHQVGCVPDCTPITCPFADIIDLLEAGCSHKRSHAYYLETIEAANNEKGSDFKSFLCTDFDEFKSGDCTATSNSAQCDDTLTCAHLGERLDVAKFSRSLSPDSSAKQKQQPVGVDGTSGFFLRTNSEKPYSRT